MQTLTIDTQTKTNLTLKKDTLMNNPVDTILSREDFHKTIGAFRTYVNAPENKPTRDKYGKEPGNIYYFHFVFYAIFRGKKASTATHDINSERFQKLIALLKMLPEGKTSPFIRSGFFEGYHILSHLKPAFNLSEEQILEIISKSDLNS